MKPGSFVLLHLTEPTEKYWGQLLSLDTAGITLRGLNLRSFDDWLIEVVSNEEPAISPTTVFFPLRRVDCMFLDEAIGPVKSYVERFEERVAAPVSAYLSPEGSSGSAAAGDA